MRLVNLAFVTGLEVSGHIGDLNLVGGVGVSHFLR